MDKARISSQIGGLIKENLKKENVAAGIAGMLGKAFREGRQKEWLAKLLSKAAEVAERASAREKIYKVLKEQEKAGEEQGGAGSFLIKALLNASRNSRYVNLPRISEILQKGLVEAIEKINHPDHPVFRKMLDNSESLLKRLNEGDMLSDAIQKWKNGILDRVDLLETLESLVSYAVGSKTAEMTLPQGFQGFLIRTGRILKMMKTCANKLTRS